MSELNELEQWSTQLATSSRPDSGRLLIDLFAREQTAFGGSKSWKALPDETVVPRARGRYASGMADEMNLAGFEELADRYAAELTAQFRTLSIFVRHAGEVGRTHEVYLSQVLARFLPAKLRIGTGFVLSKGGPTRQQDIIVYDWQQLPVLLSIGECVVVDADAVAATIEVKTRISSGRELLQVLETMAQSRLQHHGAAGAYAWDALSLEGALEAIWDHVREQPLIDLAPLPDFIHVRGKYLIVANRDGAIDTAPLLVMRLGDGHAAEGNGLLALLTRLWLCGVQRHARRPWWLEAWEGQRGSLFESVPWPADLQDAANARLAQIHGKGG